MFPHIQRLHSTQRCFSLFHAFHVHLSLSLCVLIFIFSLLIFVYFVVIIFFFPFELTRNRCRRRLGGMTKKAPPPIVARRVIWLSWKLVVFLSLALCALALLRLHSQPDLSSPSPSRVRPRISHYILDRPSKIAFLFLARTNLPLDFLWDTFFEVYFSLSLYIFFLFSFRRKFYLNFPLLSRGKCLEF